MRGFLQGLYSALLRLHGLIILILAGVFFANLPAAMARGYFVKVPLIATSIATLVALLYIFQSRLPVGYRAPERGSGVALVLIAHFILAFVFVMVLMSAVISQFPDNDATARPLSVLIGLVSMGLSGLTWIAAMLLGTSEPPRARRY
ncbi:MAG: hypothetical protein ABI459_11485 [Deltaproteobacteria bacterium]